MGRGDPRIPVEGMVVVGLGEGTARGRLADISFGGFCVSDIDNAPKIGMRVQASIMVEEIHLDFLQAEVVWAYEDLTGFRFLDTNDPSLPEGVASVLKKAIRQATRTAAV